MGRLVGVFTRKSSRISRLYWIQKIRTLTAETWTDNNIEQEGKGETGGSICVHTCSDEDVSWRI